MIDKFDYYNINRIVHIWAKFSGTRDKTKAGKHYHEYEIEDLIARLKRFKDKPDSFQDGFEDEGAESE